MPQLSPEEYRNPGTRSSDKKNQIIRKCPSADYSHKVIQNSGDVSDRYYVLVTDAVQVKR